MLKVLIHTESDAFANDEEAVRILRTIADRIENGDYSKHYQTVLDVNGNDVGRWKYDPLDEYPS